MGYFDRQEFILRWSTTAGCSDKTIPQSQPVILIGGCLLIGKSCFEKCPEEPIPTPVACEHPSRAISAMGCRSESDQKQFGSSVAESRNGFPAVLPFLKPLRFSAGNGFSPLYQSRTFFTLVDSILQKCKFVFFFRIQLKRIPYENVRRNSSSFALNTSEFSMLLMCAAWGMT